MKLIQPPVINSSPGPIVQTQDGKELLYFGGTSYLGMNTDPAIQNCLISGVKKWGFGAAASRATSGETTAFQSLEKQLSMFFNTPCSVIVPSTVIATLLLFDILKSDYDFFVYDEKAHPSVKTGISITGKPGYEYRTGDHEHARKIVFQNAGNGHRGVICTDSVNPLDGSVFPLKQLHEISLEAECKLFIDDSQAFGVLGEGKGALYELNIPDNNVAHVASFSKALGAFGGFLIPRQIDSAVIRQSPFFTTSTPFPPFMAGAISHAIKTGLKAPDKRVYLGKLSSQLKSGLNSLGLKFKTSHMPFVVFSIGTHLENRRLAKELTQRGVWIPLIRYPTKNSDEVFRMAVTAAHNEKQLHHALSVLKDLL